MPNAYGKEIEHYGRAPADSGRGRGGGGRPADGARGGGGRGGTPGAPFEPGDYQDGRAASSRGGQRGRGRGREVGGERGAEMGGGRDAQLMEYRDGAGGGNEVAPFGRGEMETAAGGVSWEIQSFGKLIQLQ